MKVLNTFTTEKNGETVKIVVKETGKEIQVYVEGENVEVFVNNELYYTKHSREEYKYILPLLRGFVEKYVYEDYIEKESGKITGTMLIEGEEFYFQIPTTRSKKKEFTLTNWVNVPEKLPQESNVKIMEEMLSQLKNDIAELGFTLAFSHSGNEQDDFYQLIIPYDNFNEEKIINAIRLWNKYNHITNKFFTE